MNEDYEMPIKKGTNTTDNASVVSTSAPATAKSVVDRLLAESKTATAAARGEKSEYDKAYDKQLEYMKKYLEREDFKYDASADELYKKYQKQTLDAADKARRDATAQAAGLTGGYGSSYAGAVGNAAYSEEMKKLDTIYPSLYSAALEQYQNEGAALLDKSERWGDYATAVQFKSNGGTTADYSTMLASLLGGSTSGGSTEDDEVATRVMYTPGNNNGITPYQGVMNTLAENPNITREELRKEISTWKFAADEDGVEKLLEPADIKWLLDEAERQQSYIKLRSLPGTGDVTLGAVMDQLIADGESGENVYTVLSRWTDANGKGLTDSQMMTLLNNYLSSGG